MKPSTLIKALFAVVALLSGSPAHAGRVFYLNVKNALTEDLKINAVGGHNYEGTGGSFSIKPEQEKQFWLAFNARSSIGWYDGLLNIDLESASLGSGKRLSVKFNRGGTIDKIVLHPSDLPMYPPQKPTSAAQKADAKLLRVELGELTMLQKPLDASGTDHEYTLTISKPVLKASKNIYGENESVEVTFQIQSGTGSQGDRITIAPKGSGDTDELDGKAALGRADGKVTFRSLPAGAFEARFIPEGWTSALVRFHFDVIAAPSVWTDDSFTKGEHVIVKYKNLPGVRGDMIVVVKLNGGDKSMVAAEYPTFPKKAGTKEFVVAFPPGDYEARFYSEYTEESIKEAPAASKTFTVK